MTPDDAKRAAGCFLIGWGVCLLGVLGFWTAVVYIVMHFVLKFW